MRTKTSDNEFTLEFPSRSSNEGFARSAVACFAVYLVRRRGATYLNLLPANLRYAAQYLRPILAIGFPSALQYALTVVATAAQALAVHHVSHYLMDLAGMLHSYYAKHQVLLADDTARTLSRLALLRAVSQVLRNGLDLLGVSAPEAM